MSMNSILADSLTRIKNGQRASLPFVTLRRSKLVENVLAVMKEEGFIEDFGTDTESKHGDIRVELKYFEGRPVISSIRCVSKPGRRIYASTQRLPKVRNGLGISILTTSKGVLSDQRARSENVGGEILCSLY
jgi:small subunit ribosomal protein S8